MKRLWHPSFEDWTESPVTLHTEELRTYSGARGEYGVAYIGKREETLGGAALFWTDESNLYLRLDWANWYRVSTDEPVDCRELTRRRTALLYFHSENGLTIEPIKIYRIEMLPIGLFAAEEDVAEETEDEDE